MNINPLVQSIVTHLIGHAKTVAELHKKLDELVKQTAHEYIEAQKLTENPECGGYNTPSNVLKNLDSFEWEIDEVGVVNCSWSEHWNYGGHAEGEFGFSSEFLWNPEALQNYKQICQREHDRLKEEKKAKDKRTAELEIERLRKVIAAA